MRTDNAVECAESGIVTVDAGGGDTLGDESGLHLGGLIVTSVGVVTADNEEVDLPLLEQLGCRLNARLEEEVFMTINLRDGAQHQAAGTDRQLFHVIIEPAPGHTPDDEIAGHQSKHRVRSDDHAAKEPAAQEGIKPEHFTMEPVPEGPVRRRIRIVLKLIMTGWRGRWPRSARRNRRCRFGSRGAGLQLATRTHSAHRVP